MGGVDNMGAIYRFFCPTCGYSSEVSGGDDCGFVSATKTIQCDKCQIIRDVETSRTPWDEKSIKPISKLKCPKCRRKVKEWDGEQCPKCNGKMQRDEEFLIMWD